MTQLESSPNNLPRVLTAPEAEMYCTASCPFCLMADRLLASKGVCVVNRRWVDIEPQRRREMIGARHGNANIFVGEFYVGGYDDLSALTRAGRLDALHQGGTG